MSDFQLVYLLPVWTRPVGELEKCQAIDFMAVVRVVTELYGAGYCCSTHSASSLTDSTVQGLILSSLFAVILKNVFSYPLNGPTESGSYRFHSHLQ